MYVLISRVFVHIDLPMIFSSLIAFFAYLFLMHLFVYAFDHPFDYLFMNRFCIMLFDCLVYLLSFCFSCNLYVYTAVFVFVCMHSVI